MTCIFGQKDTFLSSCKASAYDKDIFSSKEFAVAGSTVRYAVAFKLFFAGKTDFAWMRSEGKQDRKAGKIAFCGVYALDSAFAIKTGYGSVHKFCAKGFSLAFHMLREFATAYALNTWVIDDFLSDSDLTAKISFFEHKHPCSRARQIDAGGKATWT